ncbi:MAG TPA: hypothetical protein DCP92_24415 [Nitrospiraceae bacterium]|jgi:hypothetical protein|nr:hypothetical protein [Nitrospiraceae bacterium]
MVTEKLSFSHRGLLYERLKNIDTHISEYSFPNIYLFRDSHQYEVVFDKEIFIRGISYDGHSYLMPTVKAINMDIDYLRSLLRTVDFLFPIPESWLSIFSEEEFEFTYREGDMDYLYSVEKVSTYRGRNLHKKRNLLKQFVTSYEHEALPLTNALIGDAVYVLNEWQAEARADAEQTDYSSCLEALKMYDELMLCGGIYFADKEPGGFILGEELNPEVFVLHFAKARRKFKGIYQYIYNTFAKVLPAQYTYLNFEQDLDDEALRIAKSSYMPDRLVKKARVKLKQGR